MRHPASDAGADHPRSRRCSRIPVRYLDGDDPKNHPPATPGLLDRPARRTSQQ
ncbi:hypothetical protein [Streptomyces rubrogriseus]|uniref:hypothetical protein n=1 Tax=Streptomyces rubrogriseus TaxID=194673 RepID=UPI0036B86F9E